MSAVETPPRLVPAGVPEARKAQRRLRAMGERELRDHCALMIGASHAKAHLTGHPAHARAARLYRNCQAIGAGRIYRHAWGGVARIVADLEEFA